MYPINERFIQLMEYLNISAYRLSKELSTSETVLSNIKKGKNKPSIEIVEKILNNYKVINPLWLLTGEGNMIKESSSISNNNTLDKKNADCKLCREKDKRIQSLENTINMQQEYIDCLKSLIQPETDIGQKRKAG